MKASNIDILPVRLDKMNSCPVGRKGFCCHICLMGPCKVVGNYNQGVCGAPTALIVARNILRMIVGGVSAHCGHAQHLLEFMGEDAPKDYIKTKIPSYLYHSWEKKGINIPTSESEHFKMISEAMHLTTMGTNSDYQDVLKWCIKLGIIEGYYGLYLGTELEDKKFGKPTIKNSEINLDCLKPEKVNIAVHGHEAILADAIAQESIKHPDINLIGVCCSGASLLAKYGIPMAAHFNFQEEVIATGIVDALVVDVQCIMPSVAELCECFHTELVTTNRIGRIPNAIHLPVTNSENAQQVSQKIIQIAKNAKENRANNDSQAKNFCCTPPNPILQNSSSEIPTFETHEKKQKVMVGFTEDNIDISKLAYLVEYGMVKGIIAVIGCVNPRAKSGWIEIFRQLSQDYIILTTGCFAFEFGRQGVLDGIRFFHLGSCINNARIAEIFFRIANELSKKINELPFLVSSPMTMSEKNISIAFFFASLGVSVHSGYSEIFSSDPDVMNFLSEFLKNAFNTKIFVESNPQKFYDTIKNHGVKYSSKPPMFSFF